MKKSFIIGIVLLVTIVGLLFYYSDRFNKSGEGSKSGEDNKRKIYSSIEIYNKGRKTFLGSIRIENEKIVNNVTDKSIKDFINENKTLWEESKLEYPTGGKTETGALWDGVAETSISAKNHIISIYVILDGKYRDDYNISLIKEKSNN